MDSTLKVWLDLVDDLLLDSMIDVVQKVILTEIMIVCFLSLNVVPV